jgi:hypothetical protein
VWPSSLSPDYSYDAIPLLHFPTDPRNAATAAVLALSAGCGVWALRRDSSGGEEVVAPGSGRCLAVLLVLLPLLPALHIWLPIGTVLAERLLYTPSVGGCLLLGWVGAASWRGTGESKTAT